MTSYSQNKTKQVKPSYNNMETNKIVNRIKFTIICSDDLTNKENQNRPEKIMKKIMFNRFLHR